jgi:hypothetical protein
MKKYNKELLEKILERDGIIIEVIPDKLNSLVRLDFICKCGNPGNKTFRVMFEQGSKCRECTIKLYNIRHKESLFKNTGYEYPLQSEKAKEKKKNTCIERFGVENQLQCDKVKEKMVQTCLKKYGVKYVSQLKDVREKIKTTCIKNFGVTNPSQSPLIQNKRVKTCLVKYGFKYSSQSMLCKNKMTNTNMKLYGVNSPMKLQNVKDKRVQTCQARYGVSSPMKLQNVKDKRVQTCQARYGVSSAMKLQNVKDKRVQTCQARYGVSYISQAKLPMKSYKSKKYTYPCGFVVYIQGYEHFALNDLIAEGYTSNNIVTCRSQVPNIWYIDNNYKKHRYFVDIYLPSLNKMIEVKSNYTFNIFLENVLLKANECIKQGYLYEIWIYDYKGNKIIKSFN